MISPANDCEIMIPMAQTGGRLPESPGHYSNYPFPDSLNYACMCVFELPIGTNYLFSFETERLLFCSPIKRERENTGRVKLEAGKRYVVVLSTEVAGKCGEVFLSIYLNQYLRDVEIKRVFHPLDQNETGEEVLPHFIPEEAEKLVS